MEEFICPKCGNRTMTKKETKDGAYQLICSKCGFKYETLPQEDERGFV